jgi:DNA-binding response OmpR family regulator
MTEKLKHCKILIVEDDLKLQKILGDKIAREGCEVAVAIDGMEGLRKIEQNKPNLVLLDLRMPRMSGFEMMTELRKKYEPVELPVVVLTNYGDDENISRATELKADCFMVKANYSLSEIVVKIKEVIKKYERK